MQEIPIIDTIDSQKQETVVELPAIIPPTENTPETPKDFVNITKESQELIEYEEKLPHLLPKLEKLMELVLSGENYAKAHEIAGYKAKTTQARYQAVCDYFNNPLVAKYVEIRRKQIAEKIQKQTEVTILRTVTELARIGYADPKDLFDENGDLIEIKNINEDTRRAIASVEVETRNEGKGEDKQVVNTTKIKFWNKNDALKTIATHLGMLVERLRVEQLLAITDVQKMALNDRRALIHQLEDKLPSNVKIN
jgi:phage terminase small subunit